MKSNEQARGTPLAGLAVKVTDGFFLVGLSNVDADRSRNLQLLKERSWFDVPLVYVNQRRAIIAIEKGAPGERAFNDAFAAWGEWGGARGEQDEAVCDFCRVSAAARRFPASSGDHRDIGLLEPPAEPVGSRQTGHRVRQDIAVFLPVRPVAGADARCRGRHYSSRQMDRPAGALFHRRRD